MTHIHHIEHVADHIGWPAAGTAVTMDANIVPPSFSATPDLSPEVAWTGCGYWVEALVTPDGGGSPQPPGIRVPATTLVNYPEGYTDGTQGWPDQWLVTLVVSDDAATALGIDTSTFAGFRVHVMGMAYVDLADD